MAGRLPWRGLERDVVVGESRGGSGGALLGLLALAAGFGGAALVVLALPVADQVDALGVALVNGALDAVLVLVVAALHLAFDADGGAGLHEFGLFDEVSAANDVMPVGLVDPVVVAVLVAVVGGDREARLLAAGFEGVDPRSLADLADDDHFIDAHFVSPCCVVMGSL